MIKPIGILLVALAAASPAFARDGFEKVRCGADIVKALVGQRTSYEPVMKIEARRRDLQLKDLGAETISDDLSSIKWSICGKQILVLEENIPSSVIHDALELPPHSAEHPMFEGYCQRNGVELKEVVNALVRGPADKEDLAVDAAWKIDEKAMKFVKLPTEGLLCLRGKGAFDPPLAKSP